MCMEPTKPYYVNATNNVGPASGGMIKGISLTPAAATANLTLREGGSGGTVIWDVQAAASGATVFLDLDGAVYTGQLHATLSGAGASAVIEL